jgi:hypothetical protein
MTSKAMSRRNQNPSLHACFLCDTATRPGPQVALLLLAAWLAVLVFSPCEAGNLQQNTNAQTWVNNSSPQQSSSADVSDAAAGNDQAAQQQTGLVAKQNHPLSEFQFDYYRDSANNRVFTLTSLTDVTVGKETFTLRREKVAASGPQGDESSEATVVSGYGKPWTWLLAGGGIGVIHTKDGSSSLAGSLTSSVNWKSISMTLTASRGLLEVNAQTISNHVMQTDLSLSIWDDITDKIGTDLEFHHRMFSDGNSENDFLLAPQYSFTIRKTKLALAWNFEYADFARPSTLGYYAPQGLLSNQPAVSWNFDRAGYYGLLKISLGRNFWLYKTQWAPAFAGTGVAAFGKRLSERAVGEWYLTAGRDALGMPSTWSSMNTGLKLNYSF